MGNQQIKKGAILSYLAIFINIIAGLLYTPWMINRLGKADFGLYVLVTSILTYFVVDYGISQSVTRLLTKFRIDGEIDKVKNLLGLTTKLYILLDILVVASIGVVYFLIDGLFTQLTGSEIYKFKQIYLIAGGFSILSFPLLYISGVYYAYELFFQLKLFDLASKLFTILFTIIVLLFGYGLIELVIIYASVPFIINLCKTFYIWKTGYLRINWNTWNNSLLSNIASTSSWLLIIIAAELLIKNISPTILGVFSGTEEIAIFAIANTLDNYVIVFAGALNGLFLPKMTELINQNNPNQLIEKIIVKVGRFQLFIIGLLTSGIILVGKEFIQIWVGNQFLVSYYIAILLILPTFLFSLIQLGTTYILAVNKLKYQALVYVLAASSNIFLGLILTPKFGALGSGIAIFISKFLFLFFGFVYFLQLKMKIRMYIVLKSIFTKSLYPFIILSISFILFDYATFSSTSIISFIINGIFLFIIYTTLFYWLFFEKEEKDYIIRYIYKFRNRIHI